MNYTSSTLQFEKDYSNSKYSLVPLREIVSFVQYGISAIATEEAVGVPMLRMNNLQSDGWDLSYLKYIELSQEELNKYKIIQGDLLFNRTNSKELVGKCEVFAEQGDWVFASYLIRVRLDTLKALPKFVSAFLSTKAGRLQIDRVSRQIIGMSNVNAEELQDLLIPLPPLKTQHTLVREMEAARVMCQSKLAEAEILVQNIDDVILPKLGIEKFDENHRSVYAIRLGEMDTRLDAYANQPRFHNLRKILQEKYSAVEIGSIALDIFSGTTPLAGGDAYTKEINGVPFVRSGEITSDGLVSESHNIFLKPETHNTTMQRSQLRQNDLLIAIVGATIGAVGVYKSSHPGNINQAIAAVRLPSEKVLPEFACWYLKSSVGQGMLDFLKRPVARANINLEEIGKILIPLPDIDVQKKIVAEFQRRRAQARQLREEAEQGWREAKENFEKVLLG